MWNTAIRPYMEYWHHEVNRIVQPGITWNTEDRRILNVATWQYTFKNIATGKYMEHRSQEVHGILHSGITWNTATR